jgi:glyoxylase-like metal-dependent hydrolase (beta-lactamase superfamily II)
MKTPLTEVVSGIFRVDAGGANVYLVEDGSGGVAVIDAGLPWSAEKILAGLKVVGKKPSDLRKIFITHADIDHIGGLSRLAAATGAIVLAGERTIAFLRAGRIPPHIGLPLVLPVLAINRFRGPAPAGIEIVKDGALLPVRGGLRVIATPGHTEDHFSFFLEEEALLFCGDIYRPATGMRPFKRNEWNAAADASSHEKLVGLKAKMICPGHGDFARL